MENDNQQPDRPEEAGVIFVAPPVTMDMPKIDFINKCKYCTCSHGVCDCN